MGIGAASFREAALYHRKASEENPNTFGEKRGASSALFLFAGVFNGNGRRAGVSGVLRGGCSLRALPFVCVAFCSRSFACVAFCGQRTFLFFYGYCGRSMPLAGGGAPFCFFAGVVGGTSLHGNRRALRAVVAPGGRRHAFLLFCGLCGRIAWKRAARFCRRTGRASAWACLKTGGTHLSAGGAALLAVFPLSAPPSSARTCRRAGA